MITHLQLNAKIYRQKLEYESNIISVEYDNEVKDEEIESLTNDRDFHKLSCGDWLIEEEVLKCTIEDMKSKLNGANIKVSQLKAQISTEQKKFWMKIANEHSPETADKYLEHYNKKFNIEEV
jgi:hypothetical protein